MLILLLTATLQITQPVKAAAPDTIIKAAYAETWPPAQAERGAKKRPAPRSEQSQTIGSS
ncbi:MAG: hypothetical protein COB37_07460 [Kordiimonadales bacterium]|nr:MAG: hypothetical protein COB37_07460 [Kordiimonadales bacterium]